MLERVLVANRGEIARRILRTCRRLDIATVAVHSTADAAEPHVREADAAVCIGPAPATASYLDVGRIVGAAVETGADAIHPGYGFLAENAGLAEATARAGLVFVGPSPDVIRLMGDKAAAKRHLADHGVPVVPGEDSGELSDAELIEAGRRIDAPLLVKAVAGGGGKGMRTVRDLADLPAALAAARREAEAAFGDGRLLLERLIIRPHHVEVQIVGDRFGTVLHVGERECSIQRRHQKLVEETPSPAIDADLRERMTDAAVAAGHSVAYEGVGTVEFLVAGDTLQDPRPEFAFLEVNTRLQVEHPITELVTGLDLVELQLRIAAGHPVGIAQDDIRSQGHAIEVRLYAEDPVEHLPQTGEVLRYEVPAAEGLRVDSGIEAGSTVSRHYDPLLAKLIAHGPDRAGARARMVDLLRSTVLHNMTTNLALLQEVVEHPRFVAGETTTHFLDEHLGGWEPPQPPPQAWITAAMALCHDQATAQSGPTTPWESLGPARPAGVGGWPLHLDDGRSERHLRVTAMPDHDLVLLDDDTSTVTLPSPARQNLAGITRLHIDGAPHEAEVTLEGTRPPSAAWVHVDGRTHRFAVVPLARHADPTALAGGTTFVSPLPGSVLAVEVVSGQHVSAGTTLVVVEAMKMEHPVVAPTAGTVTAVDVAVGAAVEAGSALVAFEPDPPPDDPFGG